MSPADAEAVSLLADRVTMEANRLLSIAAAASTIARASARGACLAGISALPGFIEHLSSLSYIQIDSLPATSTRAFASPPMLISLSHSSQSDYTCPLRLAPPHNPFTGPFANPAPSPSPSPSPGPSAEALAAPGWRFHFGGGGGGGGSRAPSPAVGYAPVNPQLAGRSSSGASFRAREGSPSPAPPPLSDCAARAVATLGQSPSPCPRGAGVSAPPQATLSAHCRL